MKTKNILGIVTVCLALNACYYYEPGDRGAERAEKLAMKRAFEGCVLIDEHEAYRNCLLTTMQQNSPKTFITAEDSNGNPLVIIKSNTPCNETCRASQTIIKTEVKRTVTEEPAKVIKTEIVDIEPKKTQAIEPTKIVEEPKAVEPKAVEPTKVIEEQKEKTWWENYQENKPEDKPAEVKCPCENPNIPCPQCVEK